MDKKTTLVFRSVRLVWIVVASAMIAAVASSAAETPAVVLALMSYPAGLLANFLAPFPVRIAGLPDAEVLLVPLAMGVLGFTQWFVVVPRLARKIHGWMRRAIILLGIWVIAEATAIVLSTSLNRITERIVCHVNAILFHAWLAIPVTVSAAAGGLAVFSFIDRQGSRRWTVLLASLFFVYSTALQASLLFATQSASNRIGVLLEILLPGFACAIAGAYASRLRQGQAVTGASQ